ncbi:hypothetical protein PCANC_01782 [Puccinia coronata f. sp. avenae]|uniref:Ribosomal RNA-processing protein 8 n=1 Tax=Puccinia coronata f. sp. avenae TaxID=200324 RepID=A0A2N5W5D0_9BASI|nr:hypothetical protein PCANC_24463 [Puccinia coronata f. sp. avenae]PLW57442.1 hypothetical protein PCANC_01782 [Puccinia coronata f. sp. avenae]
MLFDTPGWNINNANIKQNKRRKRNKKQKEEEPQKEEEEEEVVVEQQPKKKVAPVGINLQSNSNLDGSRFRILNETLYTSTGEEALKLFQEDEQNSTNNNNNNFQIYHRGFRSQIQQWPENPVQVIAKDLIQNTSSPILIADLGCGEATLAKLLAASHRHSHFSTLSYDLMADHEGWITLAECSSSIPLPGSFNDRTRNGVVDLVVCCLSLMSTDWVGMILEARRILKQDGQLQIAEVTSRFIDIHQFIQFITKLGFTATSKPDESNSHFILFKFAKSTTSLNLSDPKTKEETIQSGAKLLKPCIYKRR